MERGKVIIIPGDKIDDECYEQGIQMNHLEGFQGFSDKYNLGYQFSFEEYQYAPIQIAKDGHLSIKTLSGLGIAIFYIPPVITPRQLEWLGKNINNFIFIDSIGGFAAREDEQEADEIRGMHNLKSEIKKRSELYEQRRGEKHVR